MRKSLWIGLVFVGLLFVPRLATAQASIAGSVRDTSGGVLPGVTVEVSSPALIEKVRTAVTDGTGTYSIVDLRPGAYVVTFTLPGFNVVKREGIELVGTFTATVNAEMRVGAVEETITVTGEAPIVDVQSATRQTSMTADVISAIPSGRNYMTIGVLIPGVSMTSGANSVTQDVGGSTGPVFAGLIAHGSREGESRILYNGISTSTIQGSANRSVSTPNPIAYQEITIPASMR
jgi:hypothetical protein